MTHISSRAGWTSGQASRGSVRAGQTAGARARDAGACVRVKRRRAACVDHRARRAACCLFVDQTQAPHANTQRATHTWAPISSETSCANADTSRGAVFACRDDQIQRDTQSNTHQQRSKRKPCLTVRSGRGCRFPLDIEFCVKSSSNNQSQLKHETQHGQSDHAQNLRRASARRTEVSCWTNGARGSRSAAGAEIADQTRRAQGRAAGRAVGACFVCEMIGKQTGSTQT